MVVAILQSLIYVSFMGAEASNLILAAQHFNKITHQINQIKGSPRDRPRLFGVRKTS